MKKIFLTIAILASYSYMMAQTEYDALKTTQSDIIGTARYMSMAGAFGALGGDASAIKDNPAGLGIYRRSEVVGTLNLSLQNSEATWDGKTSNDNLYKVGFNNFSYILSNQTISDNGLLNSNWSFSYNRLKNFNRNVRISGNPSTSSLSDYMAYVTGKAEDEIKSEFQETDLNYDNINVPFLSVLGYEAYLINRVNNIWQPDLTTADLSAPTYISQERGGINEYSLGWGGNFDNTFFLGVTGNIQAVDYNVNSSYSEVFSNKYGEFGGFTLKNSFSASGVGFNVKVGGIIMPTDFWRLGLSISTPTFYALTHSYKSSIQSSFNSLYEDTLVNGNSNNYGSYDFQLQSPVELTLSTAFILKNRGLLSFEYDFKDYTTSKFLDKNGNSDSYVSENEGMKVMLDKSHTFKVGAEYKLTDNFSLRAGYAYTTSATKSDANQLVLYNTTRNDAEYFNHNSTKYLTAGFGYREAGWFLDFAYVRKTINETFYPYNAAKIAVNGASVITNNNNLVATLGFKF